MNQCCAAFFVAANKTETHSHDCPSLPPPGWTGAWTDEHARRNTEWVQSGGNPWDLGWMT